MSPFRPAIQRALALREVPGIGATTVRRMVDGLGGWERFGAAGVERLAALAVTLVRRSHLSPSILAGLLDEAGRTLEALDALNGAALCPADPGWPRTCARPHAEPPLLLFARGAVELLQRPGIAVAGSTAPSPFGLACARRFGRRVAEHGSVVVAGLEAGCAAAAHEGALEGGGPALAVLPCPISQVVPAAQLRLAERILEHGGCLVGEHPPRAEAPVGRHHLIAAAHLQAALAQGVLLVEAAAAGEALHAVHAAQRQGLPLACLWREDPAWLGDPGAAAGRDLAASGAASPLRTAEDLHGWLARTVPARV